MTKTLVFLILLFSAAQALSQTTSRSINVQATVLDETTNEPLPYANVFNRRLKTGTATNQSGYFFLPGNQSGDTIEISYLGFISQLVIVSKSLPTPLRLRPNSMLLGQVVVRADDSYLYELVTRAKKNYRTSTRTAKTYFFLETELSGSKVEMIEAYYNGQYGNFGTIGLALKKGRIGLRPVNNRYFSSTESSRLFSLHNLFTKSPLFPDNPLSLSKGKLRKKFRLQLKSTYTEGQAKVYVVGFEPKKDPGKSFGGTLWINSETDQIIKTSLKITNAGVYPFVPIGFNAFQQVDMEINRTYQNVGGELFSNTTDFNYHLSYQDRNGDQIKTTTRSFSKSYDYEEAFTLPYFTFTRDLHEDYRNITLTAYDAPFWEGSTEFRLFDRSREVENFIKNNYIENNVLYRGQGKEQQQLESPYLAWNENRILFKQAPAAKIEVPEFVRRTDRDRYNLNLKLFLDTNTLQDSLTFQALAVLDPINTYYHFYLTDQDHAYINMSFDLMEIEKRKLAASLKTMPQAPHPVVDSLYRHHLQAYNDHQQRLTKETNRGMNLPKMEDWNEYIIKHLSIDNLKLFQLKQITPLRE